MTADETTEDSSGNGRPPSEKTKFPSRLPVNSVLSARKQRKMGHNSADHDGISDATSVETPRRRKTDKEGSFCRTQVTQMDGRNPEKSVVYMIPSNLITETISNALVCLHGRMIHVNEMDGRTSKNAILVGEFLESNEQSKTPMVGSGTKPVENATIDNTYWFILYDHDENIWSR